jgi:putative GTP pyrophosphokinase
VVGIRIITHFEDEVDRIGDLIEREFTVDQERSVDKRRSLEADRFGYLSLHFVCGLSDERLRLSEYRRCHDLRCEIQIRSILQHAWAEIEHDLGYKAAAGIPGPIRRRFSRLAGLLEIADREFAEIREVLAEYSSEITARIADSPSTVQLDQISLRAFIEGDTTTAELDAQIATIFGAIVDEGISDDISAMLAEMLKDAGMKSVDQLAKTLAEHKAVILKQVELRSETPDNLGNVIRGVSLFHLFQVLTALKGSSEKLIEVFEKFHIGPLGEVELRKLHSIILEAAKIVGSEE